MAVTFNFSLARGEALALQITMDPVEDITGRNLAAYFRRAREDTIAAAMTLTIGGGVTITNGPAGVFLLTASSAAMLAAFGIGKWQYDAWDLTNDRLLTTGEMTVSPQTRFAG